MLEDMTDFSDQRYNIIHIVKFIIPITSPVIVFCFAYTALTCDWFLLRLAKSTRHVVPPKGLVCTYNSFLRNIVALPLALYIEVFCWSQPRHIHSCIGVKTTYHIFVFAESKAQFSVITPEPSECKVLFSLQCHCQVVHLRMCDQQNTHLYRHKVLAPRETPHPNFGRLSWENETTYRILFGIS